MIKLAKGDLLASDAQALVNAVNTVGVMGRGIALQFKRAFPENFRAYGRVCKKGEFRLGRMFVQPICRTMPFGPKVDLDAVLFDILEVDVWPCLNSPKLSIDKSDSML